MVLETIGIVYGGILGLGILVGVAGWVTDGLSGEESSGTGETSSDLYSESRRDGGGCGWGCG